MRTYKQIWADKDFIRFLERIKAKKLLNGQNTSITKLTKDILKTKNISDIEKELLNERKGGFLRYE